MIFKKPLTKGQPCPILGHIRGNRRRLAEKALLELVRLQTDSTKYAANPIVTADSVVNYVFPLDQLLRAALASHRTPTGGGVVSVAPVGNQSSAQDAVVSLPMEATTSDGGSVTWGAGGLPTGLSINATTGLVAGTVGATAAASSPYAVVVTASEGSSSGATTFFRIITA